MAKEAKKEPEKAADDLQKTKKKLPIKVIIIVVAVLLMEVGTILFMKSMNKPEVVEGDTAAIDQTAVVPSIAESEIVIVEDMSVDNWTTGKIKYVVNFSAAIKVEDGVKDAVIAKIAQHKNEIMQIFGRVIGSAEPAALKDAKREQISRQMLAELERIIGEGFIKSLIIPTWSAMPID